VYGQPVFIIRGLYGASRAARRQQVGIQRDIRLAPVEPVSAVVQATTAIVTCTAAPPRHQSLLTNESTIPSEDRTRVTAALGFPGKL